MSDDPRATDFAKRVRLRAFAEGAVSGYEDPDGIEWSDEVCTFDMDKLLHIAATEHLDTIDPLATHPRIAVLPRQFDWVIDEDALRAAGNEQ